MASEMVERIARALDDAEVGYYMELTRLVDGEHTYTLMIRGEVLEFSNTDDVYEHVRKVKNRVRALAVLKALRDPNKGMIDAAYAAHDAYEADPTPKSWCGLSSAFRAMFDHEIKLAEESPMNTDVKDLVERLRTEADEMHAAPSGGDTQHAYNWDDKPHRVLYDAVALIRQSADEIERLVRERDALKLGVRQLEEFIGRREDDVLVIARGRDALKAEVERLRASLELAASRLDRLAIEDMPLKADASKWGVLARAALYPTQGMSDER